MKVRLFTIVFGSFVDWFEQACVRSLSWPKNRAALAGVEAWDIWTTEQDVGRIRDIANPLGISICWHFGMHHRGRHDNTLADALIGEFELCIARGAKFIFASPDSVFGDGTIASLLAIGAAPGVCVAFTPLRVRAEGFAEFMGVGPLSNAELVRLGIERMHEGFELAEAAKPRTCSFTSGISWKKIGDGLYSVTSRLPSAYLMAPTASDVRWFKSRPKFGNYDHAFGQLLVDTQRQRVIGSSDAAFVAELTQAARTAPDLVDTDPTEPDRFFQDLPHYRVNRNTVCIWRAEP